MILGIDPGATTAYVIRDRDRYVDHRLLELDLDRRLALSIDLAVAVAADLIASHGEAVDRVAVEGAVAPTAYNRGRIRMIDPAPIIATAHIVGALVVACAAEIVPPAGHGSKVPAGTPPAVARQILERLYPAELIGSRETTGGGKGPRQHLRAAWDVAGAVLRPAQIGATR